MMTAKRKLENGEQRPAPETFPARAEIPKITDQRLTVLKDQIKRPTGELLTSIFGAVVPRSALALDPGVGKRVPQRVNRFERKIAPVDVDNEAGLGIVDDELAVFHVITQWRHAAHPHALFLGGGDLVADAFAVSALKSCARSSRAVNPTR